jgi:hypothetical protein
MTSQDLQLPPAFALPQDESISRAVELAYERDFDYIPCVFVFGSMGVTGQSFTRRFSVLNKSRKPIGYLDVGALKAKWEAGQADPVCASMSATRHQRSHDVGAACKGIVVHDQIPAVDFNTLHRYYSFDAFGGFRNLSCA